MLIDQSARSWGGKYISNVARSFVPLYFIVLFWAGKGFTPSTATVLRDTCKCDDGGSIVPLSDFIRNWAGPNGVEKVLNKIRAETTSFRGRKIFIAPSRKNYGTWESKWRDATEEFSFRVAHANSDYAYASLFHAFVQMHNFTFDLVRDKSKLMSSGVPKALMEMSTTLTNVGSVGDYFIPPILLWKFSNQRTIFFSKAATSPDHFALTSLTDPS